MSRFRAYFDEWVALYQDGKSLEKIAKQYDTTGVTVMRGLRKMGVPIKDNFTYRHAEYEALAEEWAELYQSGVGAKEIARRYNVKTHTSVLAQIKRLGVRQRTNSEACRIYPVLNEEAFTALDTEEAAYWFGFLMADGCVCHQVKHKGKVKSRFNLSLGLNEIDLEHIYRFAKFLGTERPLQEVHRERKRDETRLYYLNVSSERLVMDLTRHGCVPRKTYVMTWPEELPSDMVRHFIRGYFDGDGCITKRKEKRHCGVVSWVCGTSAFLERLKQEIHRALGVDTGPVKRGGETRAHTLSYTRAQSIERLYYWFYSDATVYLPRKKTKFDNFMGVRDFPELSPLLVQPPTLWTQPTLF